MSSILLSFRSLEQRILRSMPILISGRKNCKFDISIDPRQKIYYTGYKNDWPECEQPLSMANWIWTKKERFVFSLSWLQNCAISTHIFNKYSWMHQYQRFNWQLCASLRWKKKWNEKKPFFRSNKFTQHGKSKSRQWRCREFKPNQIYRGQGISEFVSYSNTYSFLLSWQFRNKNAYE